MSVARVCVFYSSPTSTEYAHEEGDGQSPVASVFVPCASSNGRQVSSSSATSTPEAPLRKLHEARSVARLAVSALAQTGWNAARPRKGLYSIRRRQPLFNRVWLLSRSSGATSAPALHATRSEGHPRARGIYFTDMLQVLFRAGSEADMRCRRARCKSLSALLRNGSASLALAPRRQRGTEHGCHL